MTETERNTETEKAYVCTVEHVTSIPCILLPPPPPTVGVKGCKYALHVSLKWVLGL